MNPEIRRKRTKTQRYAPNEPRPNDAKTNQDYTIRQIKRTDNIRTKIISYNSIVHFLKKKVRTGSYSCHTIVLVPGTIHLQLSQSIIFGNSFYPRPKNTRIPQTQRAAVKNTMDAVASWPFGIGLFVFNLVVFIPIACHMFPGPMAPGSRILMAATLIFASITLVMLKTFVAYNLDPYYFGACYSFGLMVLCVEVWFREDPELFNGSKLKGYPLHLFYQPGAAETKALVPMSGFTRVFGAWHAGGVCLCFFMHVLGNDFPLAQKAQTSLALGLLWAIWAAINQWRSIYGAAQFCQMGILFHSLTGPGCGLCAYWMLFFWYDNRTPGSLSGSERILLGTFVAYVLCAVTWLATQDRKEAPPDRKPTANLAVEDQDGLLKNENFKYGSTN